jgi:transposase
MNGPIFLNWFENQLMPALKNPSVIVLDNASYHNIKTKETVGLTQVSSKYTISYPSSRNFLIFGR